MAIIVFPDGRLRFSRGVVRCALGQGGVTSDKREGDRATPAGTYPLRRVFYRADRLKAPETGLPTIPLTPRDGWCDEPEHPQYNRKIALPFAARHERLWREDNLYDIVIEIGYNDSPPRPFFGSAVFIHLAREAYAPTRGCIALSLPDILALLRTCDAGSEMTILPPDTHT